MRLIWRIFCQRCPNQEKVSATSDLQSKDPKWSQQHPNEPRLYNELHVLQRGPSLLMNTAHYKKSRIHRGEGWEAKSSSVTLISDERMVATACATLKERVERAENGRYQILGHGNGKWKKVNSRLSLGHWSYNEFILFSFPLFLMILPICNKKCLKIGIMLIQQ